MTDAIIIRGDARRLPLPDASVDLVVTSPPYFALRKYTDKSRAYDAQIGIEQSMNDYLNALVDVTREMMRVLKPTGSMFVNLGDKYQQKSLLAIPWRYAIRCTDELGLILRAELIWSKPNAMPESVTDRVRRSHEHWFHFTMSDRYHCDLTSLREPYTWVQPKHDTISADNMTHVIDADDQLPERRTRRPNRDIAHPLGRVPSSVWDISTEPLKLPASLGTDHFAAFPTEWPRRIISAWSPADMKPPAVVLDPFGGTGTTAAVAKALGRIGISIDMSDDYCRIADWRCNGSGFVKVNRKINRTKPHTLSKQQPTSTYQLGLEL